MKRPGSLAAGGCRSALVDSPGGLHRLGFASALAVICALAAGGLSPARALAASPSTLAWSTSVLVDSQAPFAATSEVTDVSCVGSSLCVAVGAGGKVVTSTDPADGGTATWTVARVDSENSLTSVSCPSVSLCLAVDSAGDVVATTNPTGGASAWKVEHVDNATVLCGTSDQCQASLDDVSCPSASLCVAVDY